MPSFLIQICFSQYNIFFQLERAYILQVLLHAQPTEIDTPDDIFHLSQPSYAGLPPLPSRYASVVLPYDWHLPGKERRRKRKHRKSHGVISFQDLSLRIARAWKEESNKDGEIKNYCSRVGNVGMARYKAAMEKWKKNNPLTQEKSSKKKDRRQMLVKMVSNDSLLREEPVKTKTAVPMPAPIISQEGALFAIDEFDQVFKEDIFELLSGDDEDGENFGTLAQKEELSLDPTSFFDVGANFMPAPSSNEVVQDLAQRDLSIISNVEIEDDEIMAIWNSAQDESTATNNNHFYCHECTSAPNITTMSEFTNNGSKPQAQNYHGHSNNNDNSKKKGLTRRLTQTMLEMQNMHSLLKEQRQKMMEFENKYTVVARSA